MRAHITSSKMMGNGKIAVFWSDGLLQYFDMAEPKFPTYVRIPIELKLSRDEMDRRDRVSAASAECTFNGVGC